MNFQICYRENGACPDLSKSESESVFSGKADTPDVRKNRFSKSVWVQMGQDRISEQKISKSGSVETVSENQFPNLELKGGTPDCKKGRISKSC